MKTIILNWSGGEGDPFTVFNNTISNYLIKCGKDPIVLNLLDPDLVEKITNIDDGVDFAFTWQGLGSDICIKIGDITENLWSYLEIPLVCVHGDHPSQTPTLHTTENEYCTHLYADRGFAIYSNKHFRKLRSANIIDIPLAYDEAPLDRFEGKFFSFPKNITHPLILETRWKADFDHNTFVSICSITEEIKRALKTEKSYVDFHEILDEFISKEEGLQYLLEPQNFEKFNLIHNQIEFFSRNYKSILIIEMLSDFPVKIYGRGWDAVKNRSKNHEFLVGNYKVAETQRLYYSEYGILDISPARVLHDRTSRALANQSSFLSSAYLYDSFPEIDKFRGLFFNFNDHDLIEKCTSVVSNPEMHRELCREFSIKYQSYYRYTDFIKNLYFYSRLK